FRGFQLCESPEFRVLAQVEGSAQEVPIPLRLRRDFCGGPELDEVFVKRTEQVECKIVRHREIALVQQETQPHRPREYLPERFFVERIMDDRAPRDGRSGWAEDRHGTA